MSVFSAWIGHNIYSQITAGTIFQIWSNTDVRDLFMFLRDVAFLAVKTSVEFVLKLWIKHRRTILFCGLVWESV